MSLREDTWNWLQPALQDMRIATDQSWDERRMRFLGQLGLTDADQHPVVADLLHGLDELPEEERAETVGSDGLDVMAHELVQSLVPEADGQDETAAGYDEHLWQTFLTTNGPAWDGTAESWPAFRQWFEYNAADQGIAEPSTALLDYLEAQSVNDRVATFASYGVTIAAPATHESSPEDQLAELETLIDSLPDYDEISF